MSTRARIVVTGRVQGVGFRLSCESAARQRGVRGSVRNVPDGSVEVVAEGDDTAVESLIDWCRVGPSLAHVQSVDVTSEAPTGESEFQIID